MSCPSPPLCPRAADPPGSFGVHAPGLNRQLSQQYSDPSSHPGGPQAPLQVAFKLGGPGLGPTVTHWQPETSQYGPGTGTQIMRWTQCVLDTPAQGPAFGESDSQAQAGRGSVSTASASDPLHATALQLEVLFKL
jgi:hypothetical protein